MLDLAILGLLKEQPLHGYELKKRLGETLGSLWGISYGSLYPALRRLERDGAIEGVDPEPARRGARDPGHRLARRRPRGRRAPARTAEAERAAPARSTGSRPRGDAPLRTSCSLADDVRQRRRADLRVEARVLRPSRPGRARRASSSAAATRSPSGSRARRRSDTGRGDRYTRSLFEHRTQPPNATSSGSRPHRAVGRAGSQFRQRATRAGRSHRIMSGRIRVAIAGVGNCASSLVQGVEYYRNADPDDDVPGLMHVVLGGYHVGDVEFVAAFDVDAAKVGLDLGKAISAGAEQHDQVRQRRRRSACRSCSAPDARRPRQVLPRDDRGVAGRAGRRRAGAARHARPTCS